MKYNCIYFDQMFGSVKGACANNQQCYIDTTAGQKVKDAAKSWTDQ